MIQIPNHNKTCVVLRYPLIHPKAGEIEGFRFYWYEEGQHKEEYLFFGDETFNQETKLDEPCCVLKDPSNELCNH